MRHSPDTGGPGETPPEAEAPVDGTLGGYLECHGRPPAFEGSDGCPYTVSLEVAREPDLRKPYSGYLVFPRWAETGGGIIGHVESPPLLRGYSREEVEEKLRALTLLEVNDLLQEAISRRHEETE